MKTPFSSDRTPNENLHFFGTTDASLNIFFTSSFRRILTLSSLSAIACAAGSPPDLVKDINQTSVGWGGGNYHVMGDHAYFSNAGDGTGQELWRTDGTPAGTVQVKEIVPGSIGSHPTDFETAGDHMFFVATSPATGGALWKTDGTADGTVMVSEILPGPADPKIAGLFHANGIIYFSATTPDAGRELWRSDGTSGGTYRVADIVPGLAGSDPQGFAAREGIVYFSAQSSGRGRELWRTDGTATGTARVTDISPGSGSGVKENTPFLVAGNLIYFVGDDGTNGEYAERLWRSDGTPEGTMVVSSNHVPTYALTVLQAGNKTVFATTQSPGSITVWATEGSLATTVLLKETNYYDRSTKPYLGTAGDLVIFASEEPATGREIWKTDGTPAGTSLLEDIVPGAEGLNPADFFDAGEWTYFSAGTGTRTQLWRTDGTSVGTSEVKDFFPAIPGPVQAALGGKVIFNGNDRSLAKEAWVSDGSEAGTIPLRSIQRTGDSGAYEATAVNGPLFYFAADDGVHGTQPWRTDGTEEGTFRLMEEDAGFLPQRFVPINSTIYFHGHSSELWRTDGSVEGTREITEIRTGGSPLIGELTRLDSLLLFNANDGTQGAELWKVDSTDDEASLVRDINSGQAGSSPEILTQIGHRVYFTAYTGVSNREPWVTDGTADGTFMLNDIQPGEGSSSPCDFVSAGGAVLFSAMSNEEGRELWRTNGTRVGTTLVKDVNPASHQGGVSMDLVALAGVAYFIGSDDGEAVQLWRSNGTEAGTTIVMTLNANPGQSLPSNPYKLVAAGTKIFFWADDGIHGLELWTSDGTAQGTVRLTTGLNGGYRPDTSESTPILISEGRKIYFSVYTPGRAERDLWVSDGTQNGTGPILELQRATGVFDATVPRSALNKLFVKARSDREGQELFSLPSESITTPGSRFGDWISENGYSLENSQQDATPHSDRVPNLLKYAFNMNPAAPDTRTLVPGTGTAGLPSYSTIETDNGRLFRVEYLRKKNSGLIYRAKFSCDLSTFTPMDGPEEVTPVNETWERVVIEQAIAPTKDVKMFGVVEVTTF